MTTNQILALVLVSVAILDLALTLLIIVPRVPESSKNLVTGIATATSAVMLVFAVMFWMGVIDLG